MYPSQQRTHRTPDKKFATALLFLSLNLRKKLKQN